MPIYKYRAATRTGDVVEYRTDSPNKFALLNKLKTNGLYPISITSINVRTDKKAKKQKRNIETSNSILKQVRTEQIKKSMDSKESWFKIMPYKRIEQLKRETLLFLHRIFIY